MVKTIEQLTKDVDYLIEKVERQQEQLDTQDKIIKQLQDLHNAEIEDLLSSSELEVIGRNNKINKEEIKLTPNQKRKQIIDKAKELLSTYVFNENGKQYVIKDYVKYTVEFIVNKNKRITEVLLKPTVKGKKLHGISKCLPEDVWNDYIGQAIALGKVMNLDIDYLLDVENPSEVVVGMEVKMNYRDSDYTYSKVIKSINENTVNYENFGWDLIETVQEGIILDDTNANYSFN